MEEYISFDSHKRYTIIEREDVITRKTKQFRVEHCSGAIPIQRSQHNKGEECSECHNPHNPSLEDM